jgi:ribosomal protein L11 methyltransferase
MKDSWFIIVIELEGRLVELVSAVLAEMGSAGTVVEERALDCFAVPDDDLDEAGSYRLQAYFDTQDVQALRRDLQRTVNSMPILADCGLKFEIEGPVEEQDWAENWKQNFATFVVGERLVIRPSWEMSAVEPGVAIVEIDPGMAFGTGTHATTRLCLDVIAEFFDGQEPPRSMLDVGTGSGILSLAAAALGCKTIVANDIDPVACEVAEKNILQNGFADLIRVTEQPLEQLSGRYDLVLANILAEENIRLRPAFRDHLVPGGWLVLSGVLREKVARVEQAFALPEWRHQKNRYAEEWGCLIFRRVE